MSLEEIAIVLLDEGLGCAIQNPHNICVDQIDDPIVREKWKQTKDLLDEIESLLPDGLEILDREQ